MSNILNTGGFGCIYYPSISCQGKPSTNDKIVSKLQPNDFNAKNEKNIGEMIKTLPNYKMFFIPAQKSCSISLQTLDPTLLDKCSVIEKVHSNEILLLDLEYEKSISLKNILTATLSLREKKNKFVKLIETYKYILSSIEKLISINIVHFDLKVQNILFSIDKNIPLIIDFGLSIPVQQLTIDNAGKWFYDYIPEYYIWPPEVHLLCYALKYSDTPLTVEITNKIALECITNNYVLSLFSPSLREKLLDSCKNSLAKYANKSLQQIMDSVMQHYTTWDNYALSILYLTIFKNIFPKGFKYNTFLISFTQLLLMNLSPNTEKRLSIQETRQSYEITFYMESTIDSFSTLVQDLF